MAGTAVRGSGLRVPAAAAHPGDVERAPEKSAYARGRSSAAANPAAAPTPSKAPPMIIQRTVRTGTTSHRAS